MSALPPTFDLLALHGGAPVRESFLPYARQSVDENDIQAVVDVLKSDWLTTGPTVACFEEEFASYVGARYAVSFSCGTAALHGAAFAVGLGPGDEAITTPMTFCATPNSVLLQGAAPVFADVSSDTLNLDPREVSHKLSSRTRTILAVDYAGHPAALDELQKLARSHNQRVFLIEDACHALGAAYGSKRVGSIADMTVFSFHPVKHITTGEGGMVATNDPKIAQTLRRFRNHGILRDTERQQECGEWFYEMSLLGVNYRLSDIACALGLSQMKRLDVNLARRRQIAAQYTTAFGDFSPPGVPAIATPVVREDVTPAWHLYPIRLNLETLSVSRREIFRALRAENIGVNVHYIPVYRHPYYRRRFPELPDCPVAEHAYERLISLPIFPSMTQRDVDDVIHAVCKVVSYYQVKLQEKARPSHLFEDRRAV
jgi:perosamine synthetase